jgi:hypothetical protein
MKSHNFYSIFLAVFMSVSFASRAESWVHEIVNSSNHLILETVLNMGTDYIRINR